MATVLHRLSRINKAIELTGRTHVELAAIRSYVQYYVQLFISCILLEKNPIVCRLSDFIVFFVLMPCWSIRDAIYLTILQFRVSKYLPPLTVI